MEQNVTYYYANLQAILLFRWESLRLGEGGGEGWFYSTTH